MAESAVGVELFKVAEERANAGEIEVAIRFAERAREVFVEADEADGSCAAGSLEGRLRLQIGDVVNAEQCFAWARDEARAHDLTERFLAATTELGALHELTGDLDASLRCHNEALQAYQQLDHKVGTANSLGNVGRLLTRMGKGEDAARMLSESHRLFDEAGEAPGAANALICLGDLARSEARLQDARSHFEAASALCDDPRATILRGVALLNLGYVMRDLGDHDGAYKYFVQSRGVSHAIGDAQGVARARLGEAMVMADSTDPRASIAAFEEAEAAFVKIGQPPAALAATVNRAAVLCRVGRLVEGRDALTYAREILRQVGDLRGMTEVTLALCEVSIALGFADEADRLLDESDAGAFGARLALRQQMLAARMHLRRGEGPAAIRLTQDVELEEYSFAEQFAVRLFQAELATIARHDETADAIYADLIDQLDPAARPREHAATLMGRALFAMWSGDFAAARRRYESAAEQWADLGEPMPQLQCRLALCRVDALENMPDVERIEAITAELRDVEAADAIDSALATGASMRMQTVKLGSGRYVGTDVDDVLLHIHALQARRNQLAAFGELAFAWAVTRDGILADEFLDLAAAYAIPHPEFVPKSKRKRR